MLAKSSLQLEVLSILYLYYHLKKKKKTTVSHSFIILVSISPRRCLRYKQIYLYLSEAHTSILIQFFYYRRRLTLMFG